MEKVEATFSMRISPYLAVACVGERFPFEKQNHDWKSVFENRNSCNIDPSGNLNDLWDGFHENIFC